MSILGSAPMSVTRLYSITSGLTVLSGQSRAEMGAQGASPAAVTAIPAATQDHTAVL